MKLDSNNTIQIDSVDIKNIMELPTNFYLGTRLISNIVFPNKLINKNGFNSLTYNKITKDLEKYSCKFYKIVNKIKNNKGKTFIYSGFKEFAGLKSMIKVLEAYGYKNYRQYGI